MRVCCMTPGDAEQVRERLELALRAYRVEFLAPHPAVERAQFPSMVGLYWDLTGPLEGLPPTQEVFATHLYALAGIADPVGVRARAFKAWTALVRQHHFELALRARFSMVMRGHALDQQGLDFLLVEQGYAFGLALSVKTSAARDWAAVKRRRHPHPPGLPVLDLALDLDACLLLPTAPRQLALHPPEQVNQVRAWVRQEMARRRAALLAEDTVNAADRGANQRIDCDPGGSGGAAASTRGGVA